jgi:lipid-A-disaccharide synthase
MPTPPRISKQRSPKNLPTHLHLHPQPHHRLPSRLHIERHPRHHPPQLIAQRLKHRTKPLRHRPRHAIPSRKIYTDPIATNPNPRIFLSAGEASGDHYGAQIIAELHTRHPHLTTFGLGGREMEHAGLHRIVCAEDVAHMGITEVIRHAPRVYGAYRRLVASIKKQRPSAAILIDFPDVNFRLARELKKLNIPIIYFVSPQLWAWKRSRLRWVQQRVDRMLVIFPFEAAFYRNRNVNAEFVGHPLAELPLPTISREQFAATYMFANREDPQSSSHISRPWMALLPGSRWKEVESNLPTMLEAAALLGPNYDFLIPVASTLDKQVFSNFVFQETLPRIQWPKSSITLVPDAREALHHARASIVASGTATVQAAVIGNPFIVVYKVSPLTFRLAKRLIRYPAEIWPDNQPDADGNLPIAMVNLIAGRRIVPELLQQNFTAEKVAAALHPLLADTPKRTQMIADLADVRRALQPTESSPEKTAIQRVCDAVESLLPHQTPARDPNPTTNV